MPLINRRSLLGAVLGIAAPAIVPLSSLMPLPRRRLWLPNQLYADMYRDGVRVHRLKAEAWPATAAAMRAELVAISDPSYVSVDFDEVRLSRDGYDLVEGLCIEDLYQAPLRQTLTYGDSLRVVVRLG